MSSLRAVQAFDDCLTCGYHLSHEASLGSVFIRSFVRGRIGDIVMCHVNQVRHISNKKIISYPAVIGLVLIFSV